MKQGAAGDLRFTPRLGVLTRLVGFTAVMLCSVAVSPALAVTTTYTGTETIPVPPASNYQGTGGGDGWDVSLSPTEVFNVFHHDSNITVACHKQSDATECWPARTVTDANGNSFASGMHSATYLDQNSKKLYAWGRRGSDGTAGVVCVDTTVAATNTNPFCGYTALTGVGEALTGVSNGMLVGSRWYAFNFVNGTDFTGAQNKLLCFDVSTLAACPNQPFSVSVGTGVSVNSFPVPATAAIGRRLIIPTTDGTTERLACFDASTQSNCAGSWPVSLAFPHAGGYGSPFPLLDGVGNITGLCLATPSNECFDLSGASVATPPNMTSVIGQGEPWNGPAFVLGPRVYVPTGTLDRVSCYDYSASASCPNFPHATPGASYLYTVNADPQRPTCIWVNSDSGGAQIQNFDAYTGGACGQGPIRVLASQLVVPQPQCTPAEYVSLRIVQPPRSAYTDGTIGFLDGNGNPIPGAADRAIDANGTTSLTGLSLNTATGLPQFLITLNGLTGTPGEVVVELKWKADYDATCIGPDTTVEGQPTSVTTSLSAGSTTGTNITVPAGTAVTDTATLSGANAATAGGTVQYTVYSDSSCSKVVNAGSAQSITTPGTLPASAPVTLNTPGTYYWVASYSGDSSNLSSTSTCGVEVLTVTPGGGGGGPGGCEIEGKGKITAANGDKATFKLDVDSDTPPTGKLSYKDKGPAAKLQLRSVEITEVTISADGKQATIRGTAKLKKDGTVEFRVDVQDPDTFRIRLDGYDSGEQRVGGDDIGIDCEDADT